MHMHARAQKVYFYPFPLYDQCHTLAYNKITHTHTQTHAYTHGVCRALTNEDFSLPQTYVTLAIYNKIIHTQTHAHKNTLCCCNSVQIVICLSTHTLKHARTCAPVIRTFVF